MSYIFENKTYRLKWNENGNLTGLYLKDDPEKMNWVVDPEYLEQAGYDDLDKLWGEFSIMANGTSYTSRDSVRSILQKGDVLSVTCPFRDFRLTMNYEPDGDSRMRFSVILQNLGQEEMLLEQMGIWISLAYIMFRDKNVIRNMEHSAAVFPSVSRDYTKLAAVRRSNRAPHMGLYQQKGRTLSVGTYCEYLNLFFENASPSLDGLLFHQLILAGGYEKGNEPVNDWIYDRHSLCLGIGKTLEWSYTLSPFDNMEDFYAKGLELGHPRMDYAPMTLVGGNIHIDVTFPQEKAPEKVLVEYISGGKKEIQEVTDAFNRSDARSGQIRFQAFSPGEHKVILELSDGSQDWVVCNVMEPLAKVFEQRAAFISDRLYLGSQGNPPYAYAPVSNQGESLGRINLVLKENLLGKLHVGQVREAELCAVHYIRQKWFIDGDFARPRKLYGDFYRVMDFEYISHVFYLLSKFSDTVLQYHSPKEYLEWAAEVFMLRADPRLHDNERAREEAEMLGVFFLYIPDLLEDLKKSGMSEKYEAIKELWKNTTERVQNQSHEYTGIITEHYYDNGGFAPCAGALSMSGHGEGAGRYGRLLLANIGFSNDFRAQNPDRWWEALSYMIHSLWGGISAAAMLKCYEAIGIPAYLEAAYRATVGILYCYDTNATATGCLLEKGEAASTYSVAGPHLNRPDLSRNRFGQSAFASDGGIFAKLFTDSNSTPDWDMGEEIAAYLDGFGTKTFLYEKNGTLRVVNGFAQKIEEGYLITSYAPYPKEFHFMEKNYHFYSNRDKIQRTVCLTDDGIVGTGHF